jgi:hypothetical protein
MWGWLAYIIYKQFILVGLRCVTDSTTKVYIWSETQWDELLTGKSKVASVHAMKVCGGVEL